MSAPAWQFGDAPPLFSGYPPYLRGHVELVNETDATLAPRGFAATLQHRGSERAQLLIPVRLGPHSRVNAPAQLVVDRALPPGRYQAMVSAGDRSRSATVYVAEREMTQVTPSLLHHRGASGDDIDDDIVIHNRGNVSHTLPRSGLIWFEEMDWIGRVLVDALRESPPDESAVGYADRVISELRGSIVGTTTVTLQWPADTLVPGASAAATLSFTLPPGLTKGRTYRSWLPIAGTRIMFELVCDGSIKSTKRRGR